MIILLMLLWSLVAVSLVRFLYRKRMKWAALAYGVLYIILTAWAYCLFAVDVAHLGFVSSKLSLWSGGDIYEAFVQAGAQLFALSSDLLYALVFLCVAVALSVVCYLVISSVQIANAIRKRERHIRVGGRRRPTRYVASTVPLWHGRIYLAHCRLNI